MFNGGCADCGLGALEFFFAVQYPSQYRSHYTTISFIVLSGYLVTVTVIVPTFGRCGASQSTNQLRRSAIIFKFGQRQTSQCSALICPLQAISQ